MKNLHTYSFITFGSNNEAIPSTSIGFSIDPSFWWWMGDNERWCLVEVSVMERWGVSWEVISPSSSSGEFSFPLMEFLLEWPSESSFEEEYEGRRVRRKRRRRLIEVVPVRLCLARKALAVSFNGGPSSESLSVFKAWETSELVFGKESKNSSHWDYSPMM